MITQSTVPGGSANTTAPSPWRTLEPLALAGVSLAVLLIGSCILHVLKVPHQPFKFLEYAAFCLQLPIALLWLAGVQRGPTLADRSRPTLAAAAFALIACVVFSVRFANFFALACALVQVVATVGLPRIRKIVANPKVDVEGAVDAGAGLIVAVAAWTTAVRLPWWGDFVAFLAGSPLFAAEFVLAFALVMLALSQNGARRAMTGSRAYTASTVWDGLVIALIALCSLRVDGLFHATAFHHWGVFVSPAQMVRQGGQLLWDVPSQYGFLSVLALAAFPSKSVWTSLYVLSATCQTATSCFLYFLLRSGHTDNRLRSVFAAIVTISAVFLTPSMFMGMTGPQIFPSTESYRFFWAYACLGSTYIAYRRSAVGKDNQGLMALGCIFWVLGVFWSFESAFFTSVVWLPAYYFALWQKSVASSPLAPDKADGAGPKPPFAGLIARLLLPICLVGGTFASIDVYYKAAFVRLPDWSEYSEYARAFKSGAMEWPLDFHGSIWVVFICCIAAATTALGLFRQSRANPAIPLAISAACIVVGTTSYCMGRSHPNNILNIAPFFLIAATIAMHLTDRFWPSKSASPLLGYCMVPIFTVIAASPFFGEPSTVASNFKRMARTTFTAPPANVESLLPKLSAEAEGLMQSAHVGPRDRMFYLDLNLMPAEVAGTHSILPTRPVWTPISPIGAVGPLPPERWSVYVARFAERLHASGWLLMRTIPGNDADWVVARQWALDSLKPVYTPEKTYTSTNYTLIRYTYVAPAVASQATGSSD